MADNKPAEQPQMHAQVVGQFIRDLSFENPNIARLLDGPGDNPNLKLEVNVNADRVRPELFQSAIDFKAHATNKDGTIYIMECVYGGLFKLSNVPEQAMEPFLLINCPTILFPFLRRLVADITREGGFPPLLLDPIDFGGLYMRRQQEMAAKSKPS
jgi:preprotein translocase subunit SecB